MKRWLVLLAIGLAGLVIVLVLLRPQDDDRYSSAFRINVGTIDRGATLGTLFEAEGGETVCRAGFAFGAQTRGTIAQRHLEFTCGPSDPMADEFELIDLGKPDADEYRSEVRSVRGQLVDVKSNRVFRGDKWAPYQFRDINDGLPSDPYVQSVQAVGGRLLAFPHSIGKVLYGDRVIFDYAGSFRNGLYYDGHLYTAYFDSRTQESYLAYCEWTPEQEACEDVTRLPWPYPQDIYGLIGWKGALYIAAGSAGPDIGTGIWRLAPDTGEMERILPAEGFLAGEFYGMVLMEDKLVAGHYPTGYIAVIESDGSGELLEMPGPLDDTYGYAEKQLLHREAQSINLYAGRLWVGMYPWGFLWSSSSDLQNWQRDRLFTWPEVDSAEVAPFHSELTRMFRELTPEDRENVGNKIIPSFWGQRIHSVAMAAEMDGVAYGLGNMPGLPYDEERDADFGTAEDFAEYGSVKLLKSGNTIIAYLPWPNDGTMDIEFAISPDRMAVRYEGRLIASIPANLPEEDIDALRIVRSGAGFYGESEYEVVQLD